ncbi:MAG TPA: GNAT family N-acetyltransferase [Myxococcaceae bacterium]|nr:GNAT family N-acetyltransferase [Myxococcaceae bacterium]
MIATHLPGLRVVEVTDERSELARRAIARIQDAIWDVHPTGSLLAELRETRLGTARGGAYHLLAMLDTGEQDPVAAAAGVYLEAVNAGFVSYLAVREDQRGRGLGRELRGHLLEAFRAQARRARGVDPACVLGEVERESEWLRMLVREGRVVPLDVPYFHPWMSRGAEHHYALYLEPMADKRTELPSAEVARLIEAIWRRAYHFDRLERSDTFRYMMQRLEGRETVGPDPEFLRQLPS